MNSSFSFLCAADLHLGREVALAKGLGERFSTSEGWDALISLACRKSGEIEALLIAGDLLDREDLFSSFLPTIREGIERLAKVGIPLIAVAGNHDPTILPKIAETIASPYFIVLGKGGKWESHLLPCGVRVDGWSFPDVHHRASPFPNVPRADSALCVGIVHTDWDGGDKSPFAPSSSLDLAATGHQFWLFGHIHDPRIVHGDPLAFYAGSTTPLDRSEEGPRGAYLVEISKTSAPKREFYPLGRVLFTTALLKSDEEEWEEGFETVLSSLQIPEGTELVALSLIIEGPCSDYRKLRSFVAMIEEKRSFSLFGKGGRELFCAIESIEEHCSQALDLTALARGKDLVSFLARDLLALEGRDGARKEELIEKAKGEFADLGDLTTFFSSFALPTDEEIGKILHRSGMLALTELLEER